MSNELSQAAARTKLLSFLGLCRRSGRIVCGTEGVLAQIRAIKAKPSAVIIAFDASERTRKIITDKCSSYDVKLISLPVTKDELSSALGKVSALTVAAITDSGFALEVSSLSDKSKD